MNNKINRGIINVPYTIDIDAYVCMYYRNRTLTVITRFHEITEYNYLSIYNGTDTQ